MGIILQRSAVETRMRLHYAWVIAGVTFLGLIAAAGIRATSTVMVLPLEYDFGWDRATVTLGLSISLLLYGLCGPFAGALMTRFGVRRIMLGALIVLATAVGLSTLMSQVWQFVALWGVLVGVGSGSMALVLGATVATRWFVKRRGLVTGIFAASTATGQLIFLMPQAAVIDAAGWRAAVLIVTAVAIGVAVLALLLMRDDPRQVGVTAYGAGEMDVAVAAPKLAGNAFTMAVNTLVASAKVKDFWFLAGSFAICGATTSGLIAVHLIPASVEHGMPEVVAAGMLATMGVFDLIGTTLSGWLTDRFDARKLLVWYYTFRGISLLFLPYAYSLGTPALAGFVVFYGLDWVATVPPTVRLVADRFGKDRVGPVFGWVFASHQIGGSLAAFGAGVLHTYLGDYLVAFMAAGALSLLATGFVLGIGRRQAPTFAFATASGDY